MAKSLADTRNEYLRSSLSESDVGSDPIYFFEKWYAEAIDSDVKEPNAFVLSTLGEDAFPDSRVLLLKGLEKGSFIFYTNIESAKGQELKKSPRAAMLFFWPELERQIRITGVADMLSDEKAREYFQSRPRESQLGAWSSHQSQEIPNRNVLEERYAEYEKKFDGGPIPKPDFWGGYKISPIKIEFWQGRKSRMHDRIVFRKQDNGSWQTARLSP